MPQFHINVMNANNSKSYLSRMGEKIVTEQPSKLLLNSKTQNQSSDLAAKYTAERHKQSEIRKIMMKLTMPRLRKMQALVRGFLARRKIYPPLLEKYLLAKSVLNLVVSNVVYRQSSEIILENVTYLKYAPDIEEATLGAEKILENEVCSMIIRRVYQKQITEIVESAVVEHAKLLTRPKITYGFNLRDPLELLLFDLVNNFVGMNYKEVVREAIQECVDEDRELRQIDEWIDKYDMLQGLYEEIVNEALNESIGEYIVDNMLDRVSTECAQVVTRVCYNDEIEHKKDKAFTQMENKMIEWLLQEISLQTIAQHSLKK